MTEPKVNWVTFCKRTADPKLAWIERQLDRLKIPHGRNGRSFHAPILEVPEEHEGTASDILMEALCQHVVDDIPDDDPRWTSGEHE